MFRRLASHNQLTYDGAPDPNAFEDWIQGMEKLFDALLCPGEQRVGFDVLYIKDEADLQ